MLKRFREKWRSWEDAVLGIDDPQGDYLIALEKRLARLETEVAGLNVQRRDEVAREEISENKEGSSSQIT
ncbi:MULTISPECIES: hypothetical protein [Agrobacterium]|uniref:Uncharacterized protein n=1 Tax=Agrobacterium tumefaciens TaxID=358 RepID=A0AAF0H2F8_AGRTU|nr:MULTISPECIES: hypothetical protein [Agrobacterium]WGM61155.1 hypothetical protein CFBP5506_15895 [Agrobacterium tumefaciens]CVI63084.1 conserved hypothetical protein [Agrobacterium salinitolerans str. Hayward 0363]